MDVLVNNAGITRDGLIFRMSTADWEEVLRANLTSAFVASRAVARAMIKQRSGCIISISSVSGIMGNRRAGQLLRLQGGPHRVFQEPRPRGGLPRGAGERDRSRVHRDGHDRGPRRKARDGLMAQIPLGRAGTAADVAALAAFLASDAAAYITGQVIPVDGGLSM